MRILGIDPGTAITGYGVVDLIGNKYKLIEYGIVRSSPEKETPQRLQDIFLGINTIIDKYSPQQVAVEELFFNKNTKTALTVGQARGVILLAAQLKNITIFEYTPLQVKQSVVGYGRAEKKQVQFMVKAILNLKEIPKPDDAADAMAIAICHGHFLGSGLFLR